MKRCSKCGIEKPYTAFNIRWDTDGFRSQCKACTQPAETIRQRKRREKDPEKWRAYMDTYKKENKEQIIRVAMQSYYRRKFGLTIEEKDAMLAAQNGQCAICKTLTPKSKKGFGIDHDKHTKHIRAILCVPCNVGLGHFEHDPHILRAAATYMEMHNARQS